MAKVRCPVCREPYDSHFKRCPSCGSPRTRQKAKKKQGFLGMVVSGYFKLIIGIVFALIVADLILYFLLKPSAVLTMNQGIKMAEEECTQIIEVWDNSLNKESDPTTDIYTMKDGVFVDSEEALKNLYEDQTFKDNLQKIKDNQEKAGIQV